MIDNAPQGFANPTTCCKINATTMRNPGPPKILEKRFFFRSERKINEKSRLTSINGTKNASSR